MYISSSIVLNPNFQIYPKQGPLKGGTLLTVEGTDLSIRFSDVKNMTVDGTPCDIVESGYRVSTRSGQFIFGVHSNMSYSSFKITMVDITAF